MSTATRRQFLSRLSALSAAMATASPAVWAATAATAPREQWSNWSGWQKATPAALDYPTTEAELITLMQRSKEPVRVVGGGHSFYPLIPTTGRIISLEALNGVVSHDAKQLQATVWAGSRIAALGEPLEQIGQALANEADINMQSVGGALGTATHGTGSRLGCLSSFVTGLRLVDAAGNLHECSASKNPELFQAARVGIGSAGIITQATFQNMKAYKLHESVRVLPLEEGMEIIRHDKDKYRHIEFFGFPYSDKVIMKRLNISTDAVTLEKEPFFEENELLDFAADTARKYPSLNASIQKTVSLFVSDKDRVDASWKIFPSPRTVQFNEMEYSVPAEYGVQCYQEVINAIRKQNIHVFFPIEFRYVAKDDIWLSPFQGRDTVSISVHQYYKQDYRPFFNAVEPIFHKYAGRPHWGKLHTLGQKQLKALYPHWDDFQAVRREIDPTNRFLNVSLKKMFGVA